jgi:hypothetical protein
MLEIIDTGRSAKHSRTQCFSCTERGTDDFSSRAYLRVVGLPGDCSSGMTPSSFRRSGVSRISKAIQAVLPDAVGVSRLRHPWLRHPRVA